MRIKICGITRLEDAQAAVNFGADALGFNAYPKSPRYVEPHEATKIVEKLSSRPMIIGVFVKGFLEGIDSDLWDAVQLHGYEYESELPQLSVPVYVAVSTNKVHEFSSTPLVVDESWGRGVTTDWNSLARLRQQFVLSGGLNPSNVSEAVAICSPSGVDVCSGVESSPGIKDHDKLQLFIERADTALKNIENAEVQQ